MNVTANSINVNQTYKPSNDNISNDTVCRYNLCRCIQAGTPVQRNSELNSYPILTHDTYQKETKRTNKRIRLNFCWDGMNTTVSSGPTSRDDSYGMTVIGASAGPSFDCGNTGTNLDRTA